MSHNARKKPWLLSRFSIHKAKGFDKIPTEYYHGGHEGYPWMCAVKERFHRKFNPYPRLSQAPIVTISKTGISKIPTPGDFRPI